MIALDHVDQSPMLIAQHRLLFETMGFKYFQSLGIEAMLTFLLFHFAAFATNFPRGISGAVVIIRNVHWYNAFKSSIHYFVGAK